MRIVENSSSCLRLRESSGYLPPILGIAALSIALLVVVGHKDPRQLITAFFFAAATVFFRRDSRITLDKLARRCDIWRLDMWRRTYRGLPFDDVKDVQVQIERPDTGAVAHSRLVLATSCEAIPLTAGYSATLDWHLKLREQLVDLIFVGRSRPAPLDPVKLLQDSGRPFLAARRAGG